MVALKVPAGPHPDSLVHPAARAVPAAAAFNSRQSPHPVSIFTGFFIFYLLLLPFYQKDSENFMNSRWKKCEISAKMYVANTLKYPFRKESPICQKQPSQSVWRRKETPKPFWPYTHPMWKKQPSPLNIRCPLSGNLKTASPPP